MYGRSGAGAAEFGKKVFVMLMARRPDVDGR